MCYPETSRSRTVYNMMGTTSMCNVQVYMRANPDQHHVHFTAYRAYHSTKSTIVSYIRYVVESGLWKSSSADTSGPLRRARFPESRSDNISGISLILLSPLNDALLLSGCSSYFGSQNNFCMHPIRLVYLTAIVGSWCLHLPCRWRISAVCLMSVAPVDGCLWDTWSYLCYM